LGLPRIENAKPPLVARPAEFQPVTVVAPEEPLMTDQSRNRSESYGAFMSSQA
jgi:hypothetical protein